MKWFTPSQKRNFRRSRIRIEKEKYPKVKRGRQRQSTAFPNFVKDVKRYKGEEPWQQSCHFREVVPKAKRPTANYPVDNGAYCRQDAFMVVADSIEE